MSYTQKVFIISIGRNMSSSQASCSSEVTSASPVHATSSYTASGYFDINPESAIYPRTLPIHRQPFRKTHLPVSLSNAISENTSSTGDKTLNESVRPEMS